MHNNTNKYFALGDSHALFWQNSNDYSGKIFLPDPQLINLFWMGPAKIWGLENETENKTREKFRLAEAQIEKNPETIPIICMGEIDIRINLARKILKERNFKPIINLVRLYFDKISQLNAPQIIIWGPGPTKTDASENVFAPDYPSFGSEKTRNAITHLFNKAILDIISEYPKIKFATLFYSLLDNNLMALDGAQFDGLHIDKKYYQLARRMVDTLSTSDTKALFNKSFFDRIPSFEFYENHLFCKLNSFLLFKFYDTQPFEVFLSGFDNSLNKNVSSIELRPLSRGTGVEKIGREINFIEFYFNEANLQTAEKFVDYILPRLKKYENNSFDFSMIDEELTKEFALSHFIKLTKPISSEENLDKVQYLFKQIIDAI
jgi:hypothetical protein